MQTKPMTEDEVILSLCSWLTSKGWKIQSQCLGRKRGIDIKAVKQNKILLIEAKGAKGNLSNTKQKSLTVDK